MRRLIAIYRLDTNLDPDGDPKEEFVFHEPGPGEARQRNDNLVLRDKDADTAWTAASDGTLEERFYYCHNWRGDVSALVTDDGAIVEWAKYSAYGVPFGIPGGDADADFDCDGDDATTIQNLIDTETYDVLGDLDLDGDVDSSDKTAAESSFYSGITSGRTTLSGHGNRRGYAAYEWAQETASLYHVRHRVLSPELGRWIQRDPLAYVDGMNLFEYVSASPLVNTDPFGLFAFHPPWAPFDPPSGGPGDGAVTGVVDAFLGCEEGAIRNCTVNCESAYIQDKEEAEDELRAVEEFAELLAEHGWNPSEMSVTDTPISIKKLLKKYHGFAFFAGSVALQGGKKVIVPHEVFPWCYAIRCEVKWEECSHDLWVELVADENERGCGFLTRGAAEEAAARFENTIEQRYCED